MRKSTINHTESADKMEVDSIKDTFSVLQDRFEVKYKICIEDYANIIQNI